MPRERINKSVWTENDHIAAEIRSRLWEKGVKSLNFVSSPGAGKTTLLEQTVRHLTGRIPLALIAGDVQTENDADRLRIAGGTQVVPIITRGACHLDARMVAEALKQVDLNGIRLLLIENVGNLVCPASYDLGEDAQVVLLSTAEGDDKPLKYPALFRRARLLILTKIDLLGLSDFDPDRAKQYARQIQPEIEILELSCRSGAGLEHWFAWLQDFVDARKSEGDR